MKKVITFRIEEEVIALIEALSEEYETTKIHILENAIKNYASIRKFKKKDLIKFIGKIDDTELKKIKDIACKC